MKASAVRRVGELTAGPVLSCGRTGFVVFVLAIMVVAGCARTIAREDWGGITPDARVRVSTVAGQRYDLTGVGVFTDSLTGQDEASDEPVGFALDDIEFIEGRSSRALPILAAVAAVGAAVWIIHATTLSDVPPPPTEIVNSCPFIYSYDGHGYRLDSETFAGAITRGVQRTDMDNLDHMRPVDGRYRLLLTNERPETQYTDAVILWAVDHKPDAVVHPDATGRLHALQDLAAPSVAVGVRGADARDEILEADDLWWTGDPIEGVTLERPEDFRDGLELRFPLPGAKTAGLVVDARNTELAPHALKTILELQGDGLVDWYRQVDQDPALQARIRNWVVREGTLHVSVWIDGGWRRQALLLDVGPNLPKTQVAVLDLTDVEGEEVRIRIDAARGLWAIGRVALGEVDETSPERRRLAVGQAVGPRSEDLRRTLAEVDDAYLTTLPGDTVRMTFEAGDPPSGGMRRTVLAETTGFYHLHTGHAGGGAGRPDLVDRILDEPLFGNRYILERLSAQAEADPGS